MSIGATLAAARRRAGMSVSDLSRRTRVREPVIRAVEHDDYAACGGDFYARGHIRAIANAVGTDPAPLIDEFDSTWRSTREITAAEAFGPGLPLRTRERRRVRWTGVLAVLVLVVLGFAGYKFASGVNHGRHAAAAPPVQGGTARATTARAPSPTATRSAPPATPVAVQALAPASVAAFGPAGTADGDDPRRAALAIAGNPATPWSSDWYTTPDFGRLQAGTGLLLDMGRTVTVTSVRLSLGASGSDLQLRAGSKPVPAWLPQVASAANAGRTVQLRPGVPVHVRYLLIWFTRLPPDNAGTYQASIYKITVEGRAG